MYDFQVEKTHLANQQEVAVQAQTPGQGQVRLKIERFALTANNVTYGIAGDMLGYWNFFPAEDIWGRIPVWGVGVVEESNCAEVDAGTRLYGYYPMSSELLLRPEKISERGFVDASAHRAALPPTYNQYAIMRPENGFLAEEDNYQMLYRPLFSTAFVLEDFFADNAYFGAQRIMLSSASSKTALATAFMLQQTKQVQIIGLTSSRNANFVKGLGLYDEVVLYDEVASLDTQSNIAYIDMAGNREVLSQVHNHFKEQLCYSCGVGITHWDVRDGQDPKTLPGAKPEMFFAPTQMQKRNKDWGPELFQEKLSRVWKLFVKDVDAWIKIEEHSAPADLSKIFNSILAGEAKPDVGMVLVNS